MLRHNVVQTELFAQLVKQFGADKVWTEYPTGTGGYANAIVRTADGQYLLYEIKIADTAAGFCDKLWVSCSNMDFAKEA